MNMRTLVIIFSLLIAYCGTCQEIKIYKTFGGYRFERDSVSISPKMVLTIMKSNPQAHAEFKKAKTNFDAAGVLGFAGGFLIAFPIGTAIGGGDPEWALAAGGVGLFLVAIPLNAAFRNHALNALDIFNANPNSSRRSKMKFYWSGLGGKIVYRF
jgi:hypothetical protein